ncbi:MAG: hypothetical protein ABJC26_09475 [Gemmatimonadaceae bacterium]
MKCLALLTIATMCGVAASCSENLAVPLRTPVNVASFYSDITVPANAQVIKIEDTYLIPEDGDLMPLQGHVRLELRIPPDSMPRVIAAARKLGFRPIPQASEQITARLRFNKSRKDGIFRLKKGKVSSNERITVIDSADNYMWVWYEQTTDSWK